MTLEEALKATISKEWAKRCIEDHGFTFDDFVKECGDRPSYKGRTVLLWLGY